MSADVKQFQLVLVSVGKKNLLLAIVYKHYGQNIFLKKIELRKTATKTKVTDFICSCFHTNMIKMHITCFVLKK